MSKNVTEIIKELAEARTDEKNQKKADVKAKAEAERLAIVEWFGPILSIAKKLNKPHNEISDKIHVFIHNWNNTQRPIVYVELSNRINSAVNTNSYTILPNNGKVKIKEFHLGLKNGDPFSVYNFTVDETIAFIIDKVPNMIRRK